MALQTVCGKKYGNVKAMNEITFFSMLLNFYIFLFYKQLEEVTTKFECEVMIQIHNVNSLLKKYSTWLFTCTWLQVNHFCPINARLKK